MSGASIFWKLVSIVGVIVLIAGAAHGAAKTILQLTELTGVTGADLVTCGMLMRRRRGSQR